MFRLNRHRAMLPSYVLFSAAVILLTCMIGLSFRSNQRERTFMVTTLVERAEALIFALEAGFRSGMCHERGSFLDLRQMLFEIARQPGVVYIALADPNGSVVVKSEKEAGFLPDIVQKEPAYESLWRTYEQKGITVFEVSRPFIPRQIHPSSFRRGHLRPFVQDSPVGIAYVGFDAKPFEEALARDSRANFLVGASVAAVALAALFALAWLQNIRFYRQRLRDERAVSLEVMSRLPLGLVASDTEGNIALVNDAALELFSLTRAAFEKSGKKWKLSDLPGIRWDSFSSKEKEISFRSSKTLNVRSTQVATDSGKILGTIFVLQDITTVKRLQFEAARNDRLVALGHLAAGVAHEIRNPLSTIKGLAFYIATRMPKEAKEEEAAKRMIEETERLDRVVSVLLGFAKKEEFAQEPLDLSFLIERSLRLCEADLSAKAISVEKNYAENLPKIYGNPEKLIQVFLNLCINAIQAMDRFGTLGISLAQEDGDTCSVTITDTGSGIRDEIKSSLFTPFFTTKSKGTGLGLALVYNIVTAHRGSISCSNRPQGGAAFTVTLPQAQEGDSENGKV